TAGRYAKLQFGGGARKTGLVYQFLTDPNGLLVTMELIPQRYDTVQGIFPQPERFYHPPDKSRLKPLSGGKNALPSDGRKSVFAVLKRMQALCRNASHFVPYCLSANSLRRVFADKRIRSL